MKSSIWIFVIIFAAMLLPFKHILGDNVLTKILPNVILIAGIARFSLFQRGKMYVGKLFVKPDFYLVLTFLFFIIGSTMRTNNFFLSSMAKVNTSAQIFLLFIFGYLALSNIYRQANDYDGTTRTIAVALVSVPSFIILLNVITLLLDIPIGIKPPPPLDLESERFILSLMGIHTKPSGFPLSGYGHPNILGIYAGAIFVMNFALLIYIKLRPLYKQIVIANIAVCVLAVILADSRGTILNALITILAIYGLKQIRQLGMLKAAVFIVPALPFLLMFTLKSIASNESASQLSRGGEEELSSGNSRGFIWEACVQEFSEIKTLHLYGYGEFGAYGSGVYNKWKRKFGNLEASEEINVSVTHNAFFQALFDIGIFGAIFFLITFFVAMRGALFLNKRGIVPALAFIHFTLYFMLSGMTESSIGEYNHGYHVIFIIMVISIITIRNEYYKNMFREQSERNNEAAYAEIQQ